MPAGRFAKGEHQAALKLLEGYPPPPHPEIAAALSELRAALAEIEEQRRVERERIERQQRIAALLAEARAALREERFEAAMSLLSKVEDIDPAMPDLLPLREQVRRDEAAARLNAELVRTLDDFDERLSQDDLAGAADRCRRPPPSSRPTRACTSARQRLEQAIAALAAAEARRREAEQRIEAAAAHLTAGDLAAAAAELQARRRTGAAPPPRRGALQPARGRARPASRRRGGRTPPTTGRRTDSQRVATFPGHRRQPEGSRGGVARSQPGAGARSRERRGAESQDRDRRIDHVRREAARARTAISNAQCRFANGKYQAALKLLEDYPPPSLPEIGATLNELRAALLEIEEQRRAEQERVERQQRVAALARGGACELRDQRFDAALSLLSSVEEIDPAAADLAPLREQVRREQAAVRLRAELERMLADLDEQMTRGDLPAAGSLVTAAAALNPSDERVVAARQRVEQAIAARDAASARTRDIEQKTADAEALLEQGDLQGARRVLAWRRAWTPSTLEPSCSLNASPTPSPNGKPPRPPNSLGRTIDELVAAAAEHLRAADQQPHEASWPCGRSARCWRWLPTTPGRWRSRPPPQKRSPHNGIRHSSSPQSATPAAGLRSGSTRRRFSCSRARRVGASHRRETLEELRAALHEIQEQRRAERERSGDATVLVCPDRTRRWDDPRGGVSPADRAEADEGRTADRSPRRRQLDGAATRSGHRRTEGEFKPSSAPAARPARTDRHRWPAFASAAGAAHPWRPGSDRRRRRVLLLVILFVLLRP